MCQYEERAYSQFNYTRGQRRVLYQLPLNGEWFAHIVGVTRFFTTFPKWVDSFDCLGLIEPLVEARVIEDRVKIEYRLLRNGVKEACALLNKGYQIKMPVDFFIKNKHAALDHNNCQINHSPKGFVAGQGCIHPQTGVYEIPCVRCKELFLETRYGR
jgi:hypothetical protein